jgi:hypothetical protein
VALAAICETKKKHTAIAETPDGDRIVDLDVRNNRQ